jgi:hypothetical protein
MLSFSVLRLLPCDSCRIQTGKNSVLLNLKGVSCHGFNLSIELPKSCIRLLRIEPR